jgi:hypothetical protein
MRMAISLRLATRIFRWRGAAFGFDSDSDADELMIYRGNTTPNRSGQSNAGMDYMRDNWPSHRSQA